MSTLSEEQVINDITKEHVLITTVPQGVSGGHEYTVYMDNEIDRPAKYRNLFEFLDKATEADTFVLKLNGPGGYLDTCAQIVHAINSTKSTVTGELVGEICSAHANIFIACHNHIVHPFAAMMVHTLSGGAWGKGEDIVRGGVACNAITKLMYTQLYAGFLVAEELKDVLTNNKDLWFVGAEDINSRLEDLHALRDAAIEEEDAKSLRQAQDDLLVTAEEILTQREPEGYDKYDSHDSLQKHLANRASATSEQHGGITLQVEDVMLGEVDLSTLPNVTED